ITVTLPQYSHETICHPVRRGPSRRRVKSAISSSWSEPQMNPVASCLRIILLLLLLGTLFSKAQGQVSGIGIVRGTITDPTGAVIPKATVKLTSARPGYNRTISTDREGRYRFSGVPLGEFTLHLEAPSFAPADFAGEVQSSSAVIHNV